MRQAYFDYAATTPVDPRVVPRMVAMLGPAGRFANPASAHDPGRDASECVEAARAQVAALLNADAREIVFTSGATEANNLALRGLAETHPDGHLVTSVIEHKSVLGPCGWLERHGWRVTRVAPAVDGSVDPLAILRALRSDTFLVSLMHANNETGVINDVAAIAAGCRQRGIALHVDAAQSAGKVPLDVSQLPVDLMSLSAHKFYGPKGIGALYVRRRPGLEVAAQTRGGSQERGLRAGTLAGHQIVGMGAAAELAGAERDADATRIGALRDRLQAGLLAVGGVHVNGTAARLPGHLNVSVEGVKGELLHALLGTRLAVSAGSACMAAAATPSHVLAAMGLDNRMIEASVRFSLGRFSTDAEVDRAIAHFGETVTRLRA